VRDATGHGSVSQKEQYRDNDANYDHGSQHRIEPGRWLDHHRLWRRRVLFRVLRCAETEALDPGDACDRSAFPGRRRRFLIEAGHKVERIGGLLLGHTAIARLPARWHSLALVSLRSRRTQSRGDPHIGHHALGACLNNRIFLEHRRIKFQLTSNCLHPVDKIRPQVSLSCRLSARLVSTRNFLLRSRSDFDYSDRLLEAIVVPSKKLAHTGQQHTHAIKPPFPARGTIGKQPLGSPPAGHCSKLERRVCLMAVDWTPPDGEISGALAARTNLKRSS
jgi:hypothetical protein